MKSRYRLISTDFDPAASPPPPEKNPWFVICPFLNCLFCWVGPLLTRIPSLPEVPQLITANKSEDLISRFRLSDGPLTCCGLLSSLFRVVGLTYTVGLVMQVLTSVFTALVPYVMERFLGALRSAYAKKHYNVGLDAAFLRLILPEDLRPPISYGEFAGVFGLGAEQAMWFWAAMMISLSLLVPVLAQNGVHLMAQVGMRTRTVLATALFRKSLRLSNEAKGTYSPGKVLNLADLDTSKVEWSLTQLPHFFSSVLSFILMIAFLVMAVGYAAPVGFAVMVPLLPVIFILVLILLKNWGLISKITDERIKSVTELLQTIRVVKFFGWEEAMVRKIDAVRKRQFNAKLCNRAAFSLLIIFIRSGTVIMSVAMFIALFFFQGRLDPLTVFVALAYLSLLRGPMTFMPVAVASLLEMRVSMGRLAAFLSADEIEPVDDLLPSDIRQKIVIFAENASFRWDTVRTDSTKNENGDASSTDVSSSVSFGGGKKKDISDDTDLSTSIEMQEIETSKKPTAAEQTTTAEHQSSTPSASAATSASDPDGVVGRLPCCCCLCPPGRGAHAGGGQAVPPEETKFGKLKNVNLKIYKGSLVFCIGRIGSGKSSLLSGILGEMRKTEGTLRVRNSKKVAYCEQVPWIMNSTMENNILFFSELDEQKLNEVIRVCELEPDLAILKGGRHAEIGERGINLSGGQKWRTALARACYSDASVYLLDDPMGAVDAHVGRRLLQNCICGYLRDKTRIVVTHDLGILSHGDWVILLDGEEIVEQGTYDDLMANRQSATFELVSEFVKEEGAGDEGLESREENGPHADDDVEKENKESLIEDEEAAKGRISCQVICSYCRSTGGVPAWLMLVVIFVGCQALLASTSWFLAEWSNQTFNDRFGNEYLATFGYNQTNGSIIGFIPYPNNMTICPFPPGIACANQSVAILWLASWRNTTLIQDGALSQFACVGIYAAVSVMFLLFLFLKMFCSGAVGLHGGNVMHHDALVRVSKAPMTFFDTTPVGRIISRFSTDVSRVDSATPNALQGLFSLILNVSFSLVVIAYATNGISVIMAIVMIPFYVLVYSFYRRFAVEVKRMSSVSRSPVMAFFSETLHGLTTIKSSRLDGVFAKKFSRLQNVRNRVFYLQAAASRWLSIILGFGGTFIMGFVIACCIYLGFFAPPSIQLDVSYLALSITKSLMLTYYFGGLVEQLTAAEVAFNSVERLHFYCTQLPLEEEGDEAGKTKPREGWPEEGEVVFDKFSMRYRPGLPEVLKSINVVIRPQEKIGVVGRTGSGKSSMFLSLVRFVNASSGSISIDGVDIASVSLCNLRNALSIVPQDPVLFAGTIKSNLDPFGAFGDDAIWEALERTFLKGKISEIPGGLDSEVKSGGSNFSVGERQLICLCRALLKRAKILLLDECTASVDMATDVKIQKTIRECFVECTVLTIAHRLHTIVDSDRILVLDGGCVVEFDTPQRLLEVPGYHFFKELVEETGHANAAYLKKVAIGQIQEDIENVIRKFSKGNVVRERKAPGGGGEDLIEYVDEEAAFDAEAEAVGEGVEYVEYYYVEEDSEEEVVVGFADEQIEQVD